MAHRIAVLVLLLAALLSACAAPGSRRVTIEVDGEAMELADFDSQWDYGDPATTEKFFRSLLPVMEKEGDPDLHAQLLTQIARCQGLQRDFDGAHATLDEAAALPGGEEGISGVRLLLERGRAFNTGGDRERSIPLFSEALEAARALELEFHAVDAAHMLGIVEEPAAALAWNLEAIAMSEAAADPGARKWLGSLLNNTGWTYHGMGEFESAMTLFVKAQVFRQEQGQAEETRIARWCVARCHRSLGNLDEALSIQRSLAEQLEALGLEDGYVQEELGELHLAMGKAEEARPYFAEAYRLLSADTWMAANEAERLARLESLGKE